MVEKITNNFIGQMVENKIINKEMEGYKYGILFNFAGYDTMYRNHIILFMWTIFTRTRTL